jgi:hypothetical protein
MLLSDLDRFDQAFTVPVALTCVCTGKHGVLCGLGHGCPGLQCQDMVSIMDCETGVNWGNLKCNIPAIPLSLMDRKIAFNLTTQSHFGVREIMVTLTVLPVGVLMHLNLTIALPPPASLDQKVSELNLVVAIGMGILLLNSNLFWLLVP